MEIENVPVITCWIFFCIVLSNFVCFIHKVSSNFFFLIRHCLETFPCIFIKKNARYREAGLRNDYIDFLCFLTTTAKCDQLCFLLLKFNDGNFIQGHLDSLLAFVFALFWYAMKTKSIYFELHRISIKKEVWWKLKKSLKINLILSFFLLFVWYSAKSTKKKSEKVSPSPNAYTVRNF